MSGIAIWSIAKSRKLEIKFLKIKNTKAWLLQNATVNSGVLGGAPRTSLPGEFQNSRRQ